MTDFHSQVGSSYCLFPAFFLPVVNTGEEKMAVGEGASVRMELLWVL